MAAEHKKALVVDNKLVRCSLDHVAANLRLEWLLFSASLCTLAAICLVFICLCNVFGQYGPQRVFLRAKQPETTHE